MAESQIRPTELMDLGDPEFHETDTAEDEGKPLLGDREDDAKEEAARESVDETGQASPPTTEGAGEGDVVDIGDKDGEHLIRRSDIIEDEMGTTIKPKDEVAAAEEESDGGESDKETDPSDVFEGVDERLSPLFEKDKEFATGVSDIMSDHKELLSSAGRNQMDWSHVQDAVSNYRPALENIREYNRVKERIRGITANYSEGNIDGAVSALGLDPSVMEQYYENKARSRREGTLTQFESAVASSADRVNQRLEVMRLREENESLQRNQENSQIQAMRHQVDSDPIFSQVNKVMGDSGYGFNRVIQLYQSRPEGQRNFPAAFQAAQEEMQKLVSVFGRQAPGTTKDPSIRVSSSVKRKRGLAPPSGKTTGRSRVKAKKTVGWDTVEDIERHAKRLGISDIH